MSCAPFILKVGDTLPIIQAVLQDADGNIANLTGYTLMQFRYKLRPNGAMVTRTATIDVAATGEVSYTWVSGDTTAAGVFDHEWVGTAAGGEIQRWPTVGFNQHEVEEALS